MSESTPARPGAATPWGFVILLGALSAFAPISIDMYLPSLPSMGRSLGATAAQTQATLAAFLAGMAVGQFVYGPASDRYGRRGPILAGIAIYVATSVVCALAPNVETLIGGRFVQALGGCAGGVVGRAVVRDRFDHRETARMLSLMTLVMGVAPVLAPLAGGFILTFADWRAIFWVLTLFGATLGLAAWLSLRESRSAETAAQAVAEHPFRALWEALRQRRILGYALASGLNGAILFAYISSAPGLLITTYGISPSHFGWVFGANAGGMVVASQINRAVLRRASPDAVLARASLATLAVGVALALTALLGFGGPWIVLPLLFLMMGSYGFVQGNTMAGALSIDPLRSGSVSSLMGAAAFAFGALAASLVGLFGDGTARPMALTIMAAAAGSALSLFTLALPRRARA